VLQKPEKYKRIVHHKKIHHKKSVRKLIFGERQVESNICDSHTTWPLILRKFQFR